MLALLLSFQQLHLQTQLLQGRGGHRKFVVMTLGSSIIALCFSLWQGSNSSLRCMQCPGLEAQLHLCCAFEPGLGTVFRFLPQIVIRGGRGNERIFRRRRNLGEVIAIIPLSRVK